MTAHDHTTIVEGCYRCELNVDECSAYCSTASKPEVHVHEIDPCMCHCHSTGYCSECGAMTGELYQPAPASFVRDYEEVLAVTAYEPRASKPLTLAEMAEFNRLWPHGDDCSCDPCNAMFGPQRSAA